MPTRTVEDNRQPYRPENGRPVARPVQGGGVGAADDDEEVVVNSSVNQQPPPSLNRRDSTLHAAGGGRPTEGTDPNRQWQRLAAAAQGAGMYGKPQQDQPYGGRQQQSLVIPEGQEQQRYNRQLQQDEDNRRPPPNGQKPRDATPMIRRDSVMMDAMSKVADVGSRVRNEGPPPAEYGRRPPPMDVQDDKRAPVESGATGRPVRQDSQDEIRRQAEYKKTVDVVNDFGSGGGAGKSVASPRPDANKEDRSITRDYDQQQLQPRYESKGDKELLVPKAVEHGNRASELRKSHFEATHMKPAKDAQQYSRVDGTGGSDNKTEGKTFGKEPPPKAEETGSKARDYVASRPAGEHEPNDRNKTMTTTVVAADTVRSRDEPLMSQSKYSRPDTLKIIKGTFANIRLKHSKILLHRLRLILL